MKKLKRPIAVFVCIVLLLLTFAGCNKGRVKVKEAGQLSGATVGVLLGTAAVGLTEDIQSFGAFVKNYSSLDAMSADLKAGNIDCIIIDESIGEKLNAKSMRIKRLKEDFLRQDYSIIAANENADLSEAINGALDQLESDGIIELIVDAYINGGSYKYEPKENIESKATLTLAVVAGAAPYAYPGENGEMTGIDVDIARAVCDILEVDLEIREEPKGELVTAIRSGRADFGMGRLSENAENTELVAFTEPYMTSVQIVLTRP